MAVVTRLIETAVTLCAGKIVMPPVSQMLAIQLTSLIGIE